MRRRDWDAVPVRLATFVADDWPGDTAQESFGLWVEARKAHAAEHGWRRDRIVEARQTPDEPWFPDAS